MAGDGVSLPTTIAQLGSVAKTQAKAQQPAHQLTPFSEQIDKKDELKVQRVQEMQQAEQQKINADDDEGKDRRQRRKLKRNRKRYSEDDQSPEEMLESLAVDDSDESSSEDKERLGALIDLRV
jgi:hypothetical protein